MMLVIEYPSTSYPAEHFTQSQISWGLLSYHCGLELSKQKPKSRDQPSVNLLGAAPQIPGATGNNQEGLEVMLGEREL